ncbi:MAG TPA: preprotein translocase subunit SecE [Verrucomicrobiales bacterium]|jgi:preprotein translocase subunit SecE|nr:preprotein translocase subunit SecE [Verrucomicrobiales bacterium]MCH2607870.1 preprotein translocase subunit SecE [Pedosphaera sp.]MED5494299.1 preprotein translocase subunit SecE [Verrucomicrobiota bacterium]HAL04616.1 preprotein translocase subunit SecE [Verrucomicrobiales bacterium]HBV31938.1 preprotein translocase subunit SecE [Verrucomicrobiales bacterium]|tara:strand:- start:675 stop:1049 length:375 start_codon:yes stop_codon:yes gene_type:complete
MNETNNSAAPTATAETPATADPASAPSGNLQDWIIEWSIIGAILLLILFVAKKKGWLDRIRIFFLQTREELSKCSWPTRDELRGSTWMVLVAVFLLGTFTFLADLFLGDFFIQQVLLDYLVNAV